jgi:hypothetical protein
MLELNGFIEKLTKEKEEAVRRENYGKASELRSQIAQYQSEFEVLRANEMDREDMEVYVYTRALSLTEQLLRFNLFWVAKEDKEGGNFEMSRFLVVISRGNQ